MDKSSVKTKTIYQLSAQLNPTKGPEVLKEAQDIILDWAEEKGRYSLPPAVRLGGDFSVETPSGIQIEIVSHNDIWAMRFVRPDALGQVWRAEAVLADVGAPKMFGARLSCAYDDEAPIERSVPGFVEEVCDGVGIMAGAFAVESRAISIEQPEDAARLHAMLTNPARVLPVVVISERSRPEGLITALDADAVARRLYGVAHVVALSSAAGWYFSSLIGREWSVYDGAVRYYRTGLDTDKDGLRHHPLCMMEVVNAPYYNRGGHSFVDHLEAQAIEDSAVSGNPEAQLPSFGEIKSLILKQREAEAPKDDAQAASRSQGRIAGLEQELKDVWALVGEQDGELKRLNETLEATMGERDNLSSLVERLRRENAMLRTNPNWKAAAMEVGYPLPETLDEVGSWAELHFPDRLAVTRRAIKAASKSPFVDVSLVYKSLIVMATSYYDVVLNGEQEACAKLGDESNDLHVDIGPSFKSSGPSAPNDSYYVQWEDQKLLMDRHVSGGGRRDPKTCLRIYFAVDDKRRRLVVGHLPGHLTNSYS